ncbi:hypothetical protein HHI36_014541 [Cryptolaemus montrouzieri]|uniref:Uncharacterized protein n=1 Tax=Cryptolaemus montrouzieri TaxID=559131 RepID=A0ABD2N452_9CUCU
MVDTSTSMFVSTIILCFASTLIVLANCEEEKVYPSITACIKETGGQVTKHEIRALRQKNEDDIPNIPEKILCVFKCAMDKTESIKNDGKIDVDKVIGNMLDTVEDMDSYKACIKNIEIMNCVDMRKMMKCNMKFIKYI